MTVSVDEAVDTLYTLVNTEPYNSTNSWVSTKEFVKSYTALMGDQPFILDTRLCSNTSNNTHSNGTGH